MPKKPPTLTKEEVTRERNVVVAQLKRIFDWSKDEEKFTTANHIMCEKKLEFLENTMSRFRHLQDSLERDSDEESTSDLRATIEDMYFDAIAKIGVQIEMFNATRFQPNGTSGTVTENSHTADTVYQVATPMPPVNLPKFSGDQTQWISFISKFKTHVHSKAFEPSYKLDLLKRCLTGEVARQVQDLEDSGENYVTALDLLERRWHNKRVLTFAHLDKVFSIPALTKPTADSIMGLVDTVKSNLRALESLGYDISRWDEIILFLAMKKLDNSTRQKFDESWARPKTMPTLKVLCEENRAQILRGSAGIAPDPIPQGSKQRGKNLMTRSGSKEFTPRPCPICAAVHLIHQCSKFLELTILNRRTRIKDLNRCFNCFAENHQAKDCRSPKRCRQCNGLHHTYLCLKPIEPIPSQSGGSSNSNPPVPPPTGPPVTGASCTATSSRLLSFSLLPTAVVMLKDKHGNWIQGRALLDSGSQFNFITDELRSVLGLKTRLSNAVIQVLGGDSVRSTYEVNLSLKSRLCEWGVDLEALTRKKITDYLPETSFRVDNWQIPNNIQLADPRFFEARKIDMLLGADVAFQVLSIGQIKLGNELPILQNTLLGWVAAGSIKGMNLSGGVCNVATREEPEFNLEEFFKLEELGSTEAQTLTAEERACETLFSGTTTQRPDRYYEVRIPMKQPIEALGDSYQIALRRERGVMNRLNRATPEVRKMINNFMEEYLALNHMTEVRPEDVQRVRCYIPYTFVLKLDSSTTKLRVVFDASAETSNGISLNNLIRVGPTLQQDLFSLLCRFRTHRYFIGGDVEKMFRQIYVTEEDSYAQCIIWNGKVYRLLTVTYGTTCAPYLAVRTVFQCAQDYQDKYPKASKIAKRDSYMDDLLTGAETVEEAIQLRQDLTSLFAECNMKLRKWHSNCPEVLEDVPDEDCEVSLPLNEATSVKTLGLVFYPKEDAFRVKTNMDVYRKITKRVIASDIARIFDVLGLLGPVVVRLKMICQKLWKIGLDWDQAPPQEIHTEYDTIRQEIPSLNSLLISRRIRTEGEATSYEIHGFSDASEKSYGACVYLRTKFPDGTAKCRLIAAKSRVAPNKKPTIPKLELCGAELLSKLVQKLVRALEIKVSVICCWVDSTIVLHWLRQDSSHLQVFVRNRVNLIQQFEHCVWRHVPTDLNPADKISRGATPNEFLDEAYQLMWFYGPTYLQHDSGWPTNIVELTSDILPITGSSFTVIKVTDLVAAIDPRFHQRFLATLRIFGYIRKFIDNASSKRYQRQAQSQTYKPKSILNITLFNDNACGQRDLYLAGLFTALHNLQLSHFFNVIECLSNNQVVPGKIRKLNPFICPSDGLLHVGGRLGRSNLPVLTKHPLLVPSHSFLRSLMRHLHYRNHHCGPTAVVAASRQHFWGLNARLHAASATQSCVQCFLAAPRTVEPMMADLHAYRTTVRHRPFINVAVDFAAGIHVHQRGRGRRPLKAYVCVFVCMATRAVHLELVEELSTTAFIAALRRFVGRRGYCKTINCDNGTNFRGAANEFERYHQKLMAEEIQIREAFLVHHIRFNFSPPASPHFNGLAEAGVKSMKRLLIRSIGNASLTREEMTTILVQIEAALNSRPLMPLSNDPNDEALTPAHFIIGEPMSSWFESLEDSNDDLNVRYRRLRQVFLHFWQRWHAEYVTSLQERNKWQTSIPNVTVGTLVLLKDDSKRPLQWSIGRITDVHRGPDAIVRVVSVKTRSGIFKRATTSVCPLPSTN